MKKQYCTASSVLESSGDKISADDNGRIMWGNGVISILFATSEEQPVRIIGASGRGMRPVDRNIAGEPDAQPIVEMRSSLDSGGDSHLQLAKSASGLKLRFVEAYVLEPADESAPDAIYRLSIVQQDPHGEGPTVISVFEAYPHASSVRTYTVLTCDHEYPVEAISSMNFTLPLVAARLTDSQTAIYWGENSWDLENAWRCRKLRSTPLRDRNLRVNPGVSSARFNLRSSSTWSTGEFAPTGIIHGSSEEPASGEFSFIWQIEHNGAWEWEIGEDDPGIRISAYGPEYVDHQWFTMLGTGNDFCTVPVSFALCEGGWQQAVAEITVQRRESRIRHARELGRAQAFDRMELKVVYNDSLHGLQGNPRIEKELPLVEGASQLGADVFCIDAGWFDDSDNGWWDIVGDWEPSIDRFGTVRLAGLIHDIQSHGMEPGLWIEPEVIGMHSRVAQAMPDSAFFCRHGSRISDQGRYHLDFRSPIAREYATHIIDRLITEYDLRYFKFDYNTTPGVGTDVDTQSVGEGLLEHCRAVQEWIDSIRQKYPNVMIENAASGAMRADYAMLTRTDIQSVSYQADPSIYAAIAAGAGLSILPEQQGNWSYAQEEMNDEAAVFSLASGILSRMYLCGFVDRISDRRRALIRDAVQLHRHILDEQGHVVPWWPDDLPFFNGPWLVYGLRHDRKIAQDLYPDVAAMMDSNEHVEYLTVWRRCGIDSLYLHLGRGAHIQQVFPNPDHDEYAPQAKPWTIEQIDPETVRLTVATTEEPSARVFAVSYGNPEL